MVKKLNAGRVFDRFNILFMVIISFLTIYPLLYVLFGSLSDSRLLVQHRGILLKPIGFSLQAYRLVFENPMVLVSYRNTLIYLVLGTFISVILTVLGAYALSRRNVFFSNAIMLLIVFTMFFDGGLVPTYLLVRKLHLYNTIWAVIIPSAISVWNLIIMRTGFQAIPVSMEESARIDGANDFTILAKIIMPLSMPVVAVIILFYGVGIWNSYFNAMIFLRDRGLYPLQLILREILIVNETDKMITRFSNVDKLGVSISIKYATIIVATVPVLCVYPFLQRYFVKGIMIGAIKQ